MRKSIFAVANEYKEKFAKTAGKQRLSRGRISKSLDKAKGEYAKLKDSMDVLEANDAKLRGQLEGTRKSVQEARSRIMKMHKAMQNMDLANANDAIFYDGNSADDIGYVINGKEFHLDISDDGEVNLTPMNKHRKSKKDELSSSKKEEEHKDEHEANDDKKEDGEDFDDLYADLVE